MTRFTAICAHAIVIVGLLTQTSGSNWLKADASTSTRQQTIVAPRFNTPLQGPWASPNSDPSTGQISPDASSSAQTKGSRVYLQVDFESRVVLNNQSLQGALRVEWQAVNGEAAPPTVFTATMDFPTGLDYMIGSSTGLYDAALRRLTWPTVQFDAKNQLKLPFQAIVNVQALDTPMRLSMRPNAQGDANMRFVTRPTQLQVLRTMPGQRITAMDGGTVRTSNGRVQLDFDVATISVDSVVITGDEYAIMPPSALMPDTKPSEWKVLAKSAYEDSFGADPEQSLDSDIVRLSMADPLLKVDFYPSMVFSRPVTATFDLSGQAADELAASGLAPILQSVIEEPFTSTYVVSPTLSIIITNTRKSYEEVPSWYDPLTGRLTAFIGHFSDYVVTPDAGLPKPWKLLAGLGEVNVFRGAYGYQYPIEVPAMQDGLAPKLDLSYSSAKADFDSRVETLGHGWNLDLPKVARKMQQTAQVVTNIYPILQGPDEGNCPNPPNAGWCWYSYGSYDTISGYQLSYEDKFTLNFGGQDMYLVRKSASVSEYVTLNYVPLRIIRCSDSIDCGGEVVSHTNASHEYWQVWTPDGVRYTFGTDNQSEARLNQTTPTAVTATQAWYLKSVYAPYRDDPTTAVNRASVEYVYQQNSNAGGVFQTILKQVNYGNRLRSDGTTVTPQYSVTLDYVTRTGSSTSQPLTITARAAGNTTRQYLLSYTVAETTTMAQLLSGVRAIAPNGATLPPLSFTYMVSQSRYLITQTLNGYNGSMNLAYQLARGGFRMLTSQHADKATNWRDYTYYVYYDESIRNTEAISGYSPCYDWLTNDAITGAPLCRVSGYDYLISGTYQLLGYPIVEVQARNPDNPAEWLGTTKHYFKFETWKLGQEFRTRQEGRISAVQYAPGELPISESWVTATLQLTTGLPVSVTFGAPSEKVEYPDLGNPGVYKRTTYAYSPTLQGGVQLGQQTDVWEYNTDTLVRHAQTTYTMTQPSWTLCQTTMKQLDDVDNWVSEQRLYCNTLGKVTFTQGLINVSGSTRDIAYDYDILGNVVTKTELTSSGTTANPSVNGRSGITTTYAYDQKFGSYLVTTTNALTQSTVYFYYGVNETMPVAGQPFGSLKAARDPNSNQYGNGVIQTLFYYDPFGRLRKIARPGDSFAAPTEEYQYYDGVKSDEGGFTQTTAFTDSTANPLLVVHLVYGGSSGHFTNTNVANWERTFYDGLGRVIEVQTNGVYSGTSRDKVVYTRYDGQGRAIAQSVPYFISPYVFATTTISGVTVVRNPYQPPDLSQPQSATQYDVLGRVVGSNAPGQETTTSSYAAKDGTVSTIAIDPRYFRRDSSSDLLGRVTAVREYTSTPWIREEENSTGVSSTFLDHKTATAVVTKPPPFTVDPVDHFIYGPGTDLPVPVAGPGQVVQFRLAIDNTTSGDAYVANINVRDIISGDVFALRWIRRSEFRGGLDKFSEFALPFNTTGRLGHGLELRVWWAGNAQMAVDRTTLYWSNTLSQTTAYSYDVRDKLTRVVDALGSTTVITYNPRGLKTGMVDPDMGAWSYGYDLNGNLITQTDALNKTLWFGYDALNRLVEKRNTNDSGALLASYGYDAAQNGIGRRISMSNSSASAAWSYDQYGRLITDTRTITAGGLSPVYTTTFAYDRLDRVLTTTYPSGEAVGMTYDAVGQPISLTGLSNYVTNATYNVLGLPTRIDFGNGLGARYTYYGLEWLAQGNPLLSYGRLRQACVIAQTAADCPDAGTPDALLNMAYAYDSVGNITNIGDRTLGAHHLFGYDALNRLVSVAQSYTQAYAYDVLGNITSKPIVSGTGTVDVAYTYGVTQPHAVRSLSNGSSFQYDTNGNMTQRIEVSGTQLTTYTQGWDIDNRLIVVTNTVSGQATNYFYDADGQRVARSDISGTTVYIGQYYEVQLSTGITTSYYTFSSQRVAMRTGSSVYWLHGDHLGSASLTTGITGAVVSEMRYYPFGEVRWISGTMPTDHTFTGQRVDPNLGGAMDYGARFYLPGLGRFMSADSVVPQVMDSQSLNRYAYVRNSPLNFEDPSGHGGCAAQDQQCWVDRYNRAHGLRWNGKGWDHVDATFDDMDILEQTVREAGFNFDNSRKSWGLNDAKGFNEGSLVARGIVALANKLSSIKRLKELVGATIHSLLRVVDMGFLINMLAPGTPAGTDPYEKASPVYFADATFTLSDDNVSGLAVHEIFHIIQYNTKSWNPDIFLFTGLGPNDFPHTARLSQYAINNNLELEYWGEAGADWVYGTRYSYTRNPSQGLDKSLDIDQSNWLMNTLK